MKLTDEQFASLLPYLLAAPVTRMAKKRSWQQAWSLVGAESLVVRLFSPGAGAEVVSATWASFQDINGGVVDNETGDWDSAVGAQLWGIADSIRGAMVERLGFDTISVFRDPVEYRVTVDRTGAVSPAPAQQR